VPGIAATIVPFESVLRSELESWKSVVEPVFETEKRVEVAAEVDEPMAKRVFAVSPLFVAIENLAKGLEEPTPSEPVVGSDNVLAEVVAGKSPKI
jgi:hypothetical protein